MISLFFFTLFMSIILGILAYKVKLFQKQLKLYSYLFTLCAATLFLFFSYQHKQMWLPKIQSVLMGNQEIPTVSAMGVSNNDFFKDTPLINDFIIQSTVQLQAPKVLQYPELPRGCEVTSLTMLLQYSGFKVDKMTLANQIAKDNTPYKKKNGKEYFGNPNDGFVGNMYDLTEPGYGVYHKPIAQLAEKYAGDKVKDLTGESFYEVLKSLNNGQPVLVIINAKYKKLPESAFKTWQTPNGPVKITMNEHAVLITGYDENYIYFNDPLNKTKKAPFDDFIDAWVQMGKQAITIEQS
nr:peptidase C39 family protein [Salirhabdus euzebyi]